MEYLSVFNRPAAHEEFRMNPKLLENRNHFLSMSSIKDYAPVVYPNVWEMIWLTNAEYQPSLRIPDTLLELSSASPTVLLYSDMFVRIKRRTSNALSTFIERTEKSTEERKGKIPKYILFRGNDQPILFRKSTHAVRQWNNCKKHPKVLQKFLVSHEVKSRRIRMQWSLNFGITCFLIENHVPLASALNSPRDSRKTFVFKPEEEDKYFYRTTEFPYAGRILKTSFSPSLPFKPRMKVKLSQKRRQSLNPNSQQKAAADNKQYFTSFSKPEFNCNITKLRDSPFTIKYMIKHIFQVIHRTDHNSVNREITEIVADFIEDHNE